MTNKILIIAGSDSCGGAGIQADIKTATALYTYCATAITCLTAQNSQKIYNTFYPPIEFLNKQIEVVLDDMDIDVIKIGMLGNAKIVEEVAKILRHKARDIPIVLDPVMVSTSGDSILMTNAIDILKANLITDSYLVTPNIFEAEILSGVKINNFDDVKIAALKIKNIGQNFKVKNVLIKGSHLESQSDYDERITHYLLLENGDEKIFSNKKLPFKKLHGTGCTLATAISCFLSHGLPLENAIKKANLFTYKTIKNSQTIGLGSRILLHY